MNIDGLLLSLNTFFSDFFNFFVRSSDNKITKQWVHPNLQNHAAEKVVPHFPSKNLQFHTAESKMSSSAEDQSLPPRRKNDPQAASARWDVIRRPSQVGVTKQARLETHVISKADSNFRKSAWTNRESREIRSPTMHVKAAPSSSRYGKCFSPCGKCTIWGKCSSLFFVCAVGVGNWDFQESWFLVSWTGIPGDQGRLDG